MSVAVTTRSYDNTRAGANIQESILTPTALRHRGLKRLLTLSLPGDLRGCEAQPLVVPGVQFADGAKYDVVYIATMANQVFAFDANSGARLWMVQLGKPVLSNARIDPHRINDQWGIVATPVIDLQSGHIYVCAWSSPDATSEAAHYVLHALRLSDGVAAHAPLSLEAVSYNPGHGRPVQHFRSADFEQRAALLLQNGTVFVAFGSWPGGAATSRGWVMAVDTARFLVAATWTSTARGAGGAIGSSGAGPAADAEGNIYVLTGNGDFDGATDFGASIVKLRYFPPRGNGIASLSVADWWTALDESGGDRDFAAAGPVLVPNRGAVLAAGGDGTLHTANMQHLGQSQRTSGSAAANEAKLKAPPIYYTYYPSPLPSGRTHRLYGTPVLWKSAAQGFVHYCWGENGNLRAWTLSNSGASTYLGCSAETASAELQAGAGGGPGGMICLSAAGDANGILWASIPYGDAARGVSAGRFLAYDAVNFAKYSDGSGAILPLWDSQAWNWRFTHNRFNRPVVWNGRVFLPTYDAEVWVLGLA